jgi:uncharacterized protein YdiU (UPF0061 family)
VYREEIETAAVVTRVAPSFIRFGHFEHFSARGQLGELKTLADFVIDRFYPACRETAAFDGNPYAALLEAVSGRTAAMVAQWQAVGFCHGVMNTDNMSILGLTLDYGPFQFLDAYDPGHICNHSDPQGRYAYDRQPNIAYWNLFCLGQALLPLIGEPDQAMAALEPFKTVFPRELVARMRAKLGLTDAPREQDRDLIDALLMLMAQDRVDYSIFWRRLSRWMAGEGGEPVQELFIDRGGLDAWMLRYQERIKTIPRWDGAHQMLKTNPRYILRNHLGEEAIRAAKVRDYSWDRTSADAAGAPVRRTPWQRSAGRISARLGLHPLHQLFIMTKQTTRTDAEWKALLAEKGAEPLAFEVTRHAATERPFTGKYEDHWDPRAIRLHLLRRQAVRVGHQV